MPHNPRTAGRLIVKCLTTAPDRAPRPSKVSVLCYQAKNSGMPWFILSYCSQAKIQSNEHACCQVNIAFILAAATVDSDIVVQAQSDQSYTGNYDQLTRPAMLFLHHHCEQHFVMPCFGRRVAMLAGHRQLRQDCKAAEGLPRPRTCPSIMAPWCMTPHLPATCLSCKGKTSYTWHRCISGICLLPTHAVTMQQHQQQHRFLQAM